MGPAKAHGAGPGPAYICKNLFQKRYPEKTLIYNISLKDDSLIFFQKRRAQRTTIKFGGGFAPRSLI